MSEALEKMEKVVFIFELAVEAVAAAKPGTSR